MHSPASPCFRSLLGRRKTKRQIVIYSALLMAISVPPWVLGFAGAIYGATAVGFGAVMRLLALRLRASSIAEQQAARHLFAFSILYLFVPFAVLLVDAH